MSIYYNFCYVDLDRVKSPTSEDGQFYLLENQSSYEGLSNPTLFKTMNNHFVKECFNETINKLDQKDLVSTLKFAFGNMFWAEIRMNKTNQFPYLLNYWQLEWQQANTGKFNGFLDWYSIHQNDIQIVLSKLDSIILEDYFLLAKECNQLNKENDELNRTVINEWINMYSKALQKKKGIVFDIG